MICFSVIHGSNCQLPKLQCRTCKKRYHSACLVSRYIRDIQLAVFNSTLAFHRTMVISIWKPSLWAIYTCFSPLALMLLSSPAPSSSAHLQKSTNLLYWLILYMVEINSNWPKFDLSYYPGHRISGQGWGKYHSTWLQVHWKVQYRVFFKCTWVHYKYTFEM